MTAAILSIALAMSGCASIVNGTQQSISVLAQKPDSSDLSGASCSFSNGKGRWFATAPGSVTVHRAYSALIVECEHSEWVGGTEARSSTKPMAFGNILFGGVIGAGVDIGTGAAYDYPQLITVPMTARVATTKDPAGSTALSPAPTMVLASTVAEPVRGRTVLATATPPPPPANVSAAPAVSAMLGMEGTQVSAVPPIALESLSSNPSGNVLPATAQPIAQDRALIVVVNAGNPQTERRPLQVLKGGQDSFSAARIARDSACHSQPNPVMTAKGPGFENYSVVCVNDEALAIRCEFGNCRVLR